MKRVVILGLGSSGKTTLALRLGQITGLRVVELDKIYWRPGLVETPHEEWIKMQHALTADNGWILDGDLGPGDAVEVRLQTADTVIFLDFSLVRCAWRALWRSREHADFWLWLLRYRKHSRPFLMRANCSTRTPGKIAYSKYACSSQPLSGRRCHRFRSTATVNIMAISRTRLIGFACQCRPSRSLPPEAQT